MNTYEALVIFKPTMDTENCDGAIRTVENFIRQQKGKLLHVDKVGRKRLAFDIQNLKDGFIAVFVFQMSPAHVALFLKSLQLNEDVIRISVVRAENFDPNTVNSTPSITSTVTSKELRERDLARASARSGRSRRPHGGEGGGPRHQAPVHDEDDAED